jgi:hypothetical protein
MVSLFCLPKGEPFNKAIKSRVKNGGDTAYLRQLAKAEKW